MTKSDIETRWSSHIQQGEDALRAGSYAVAATHYRQAWQEAEQHMQDMVQAYHQGIPVISLWVASCNRLAALFEEWRKPAHALYYYQKACDCLSFLALDSRLQAAMRQLALQEVTKAHHRLCHFYESESQWKALKQAHSNMDAFNTRMKKDLIKQ